MNDTLDYFAVSEIDNFVNENLLNTQRHNGTTQSISKDAHNSISFDDSIFLDDYISQVVSTDDNSENTFLANGFHENIIESCNIKPDQIDESIACSERSEEKLILKNSEIGVDNLSSEIREDKSDILNVNFQNARYNKSLPLPIENHVSSEKFSALSSIHKSECCDNSVSDNEITSQSRNSDSHLLSSWGLPELVLKNYEKRNIISMFDWQLECLSKNQIVKENKNLVYSAPTSAGKTLVAEVLAIKCLFERNKKIFLDHLMAVGTIEKCNSLVNRLLEEGKLEDIGLVIIDEVHLLGDPHRGYLLELLLTKLKYIMCKNENIQIQIVGMSATLPNLDLLAKWLDAELFTTNFRPIPLHEMVYVNKELYNNEFKLLRKLSNIPELATDTDDILQLCLETIEMSCSVLMFCPTKNWCENLAQQVAMAFWRIGRSNTDLSKILHKNLSVDKITEILEQLKYCPSGLDKILKNTIAFGVAFHHAGLTMEERDIIEGGFRNGGIRLLIATSTLSSGVNLPARRVIIRSPIFNGRPIDILTYRQMIGRAGRMGIDSEGQSILICQKSDYNTAKFLTQSSLKPVQSCLEDVGKFKRAILEIIASGVASSPDDINIFEKCTLISVQDPEATEKIDPITQVVEFLVNFQFIRLHVMEDGSSKYFPTALGKACLSSSMPPGEGLELFTELEKARQCFVLETELHLIYTVTPYSACYQWSSIDWMFYLNLWEKLPLSMKRVGELVGVRESVIVNATRGKLPDSSKLFTHKRFYVSLILQDLVNEKPLDEVAAKFNCNRGVLQSLQQSASTFAGMVTSFSRQLGWSSVEILISQFQDRLQFGVNRDLLDLMRLPCLNSKQARAFFNAGIETLIQLANSDTCTIENILHKVVPFENIKEREGETEHQFKQRYNLRTIWITGKQGLTEKEAAVLILKDAREYLEHEMGVENIKWGCVEEEISETSSSNDSLIEQNVAEGTFRVNSEDETGHEVLPHKKNSCNSHSKVLVEPNICYSGDNTPKISKSSLKVNNKENKPVENCIEKVVSSDRKI
ncbi:hypothetical protein HHI36_011934 [Cryptolaemus montrouzieri]|uniref:DNA polymerase theta n=1 Tax=Cryptolaemus montrouzieri TaxID=559131 RepID=A0ABD2NDP0_9CUCU